MSVASANVVHHRERGDERSVSTVWRERVEIVTSAPGNGSPIGGVKVVTENGWFAARPSGTEDVYKIYAESFRGPDHLREVQDAAREVVSKALA